MKVEARSGEAGAILGSVGLLHLIGRSSGDYHFRGSGACPENMGQVGIAPSALISPARLDLANPLPTTVLFSTGCPSAEAERRHFCV